MANASRTRFCLFILLVSTLVGCDETETTVEGDWKVIRGDSLLQRTDSIGGLGNPRSLMSPTDTALYFIDWSLNGLHRYSTSVGTLSSGTGIGQGPGQIRDESAYFLAPLSGRRIWLHDRQQGRVTIFDAALNTLEDITISGSMRTLPVKDSLLVTVPRVGDRVVDIRPLQRSQARIEGTRPDAVQRAYSAGTSKKFEPVGQNYALRYGPSASCGGSVIVGFEFSSFLIRARKDTIDVLEPPTSVPFPVQEGQARLPNWFNPKGTLDLACDSSHIYSLFSGKHVSRSKVRTLDLSGRLTSTKQAELSAQTERSTHLHVYDREEGAFAYEIQLPTAARKIAVNDKYLYVLRHRPDGPHILHYSFINEKTNR